MITPVFPGDAGRRCPAPRPSVADVRQQAHEPRPLDGVLDGPLIPGTVAAALAAEHLALRVAELLQRLHVLVVHESRPGTAFLRAKAAAILTATTQFLANHWSSSLVDSPVQDRERINLGSR